MMHGYIKLGNVSCRIVSYTSLFMCKSRVTTISMACPCCSMPYLGIIGSDVAQKTMAHVKYMCLDNQF